MDYNTVYAALGASLFAAGAGCTSHTTDAYNLHIKCDTTKPAVVTAVKALVQQVRRHFKHKIMVKMVKITCLHPVATFCVLLRPWSSRCGAPWLCLLLWVGGVVRS